MGKFVIKNAKNGLKFDLKAANGQVIASSQVYKHKKTCLNGTASVMKNAPDAALEDQTVKAMSNRNALNLRYIRTKKANTASALKPPTGRSLPSVKAM